MSFTFIMHSSSYDRVHYGLVLASTAAALERGVTLFWTGKALCALCVTTDETRPAWHGLESTSDGTAAAVQDEILRRSGIATFEELLLACRDLGVEFEVCDMAVRMYFGDREVVWRQDLRVKRGGVTALLCDGTRQVVFI